MASREGEIDDGAGIGGALQGEHRLDQPLARCRCQYLRGILLEFGDDFGRGHRIGGGAAVVLLHRLEAAAVAKRDLDRPLEALRARKIRIDAVFDPVGDTQDLGIAQEFRLIGILAEPAADQRFGEAVLQADPAMGVRAGAALLRDGLADDADDIGGHGTGDSLDLARIDPMRGAQAQDGVEIGMDDMGRGEGLEGGPLAFPMLAQTVGDAAIVARHRGILEMGGEESEAALQDRRRAGGARAR